MIRLVPFFFAMLAGCGFADAETRAPEAAAVAIPLAGALRVEVAELRTSEARLHLSLPGEVEGSRDARLAAALGGYVESVAVVPGQTVSRGTVIARVDATLHQAGAERARAQLAFAEGELARLEKLGDLGTAQQLASARLQVELGRTGLVQAETQLARAVLTAPFSGVIAEVWPEAGEVLGPGAPVARLVRLDPVKVTLSVADRDVVALRRGDEVSVTTNARAGVFGGTITHVAAAANQSTRSFLVEVEVPNPDGLLLPGMIARASSEGALATAGLVVPQDWIVTRRDGQGVFVEDDGVARWRPIALGAVVRDQVVVTAGLDIGDRVVVTGHRDLVDGDPLIVSRRGTCCRDGRAVFTEG